jgi:hypothetical protein
MPLGRRIRESLSWRIAITAFAINVVYVNSYLGNPMSKSILDLTVSLVDRGKLNIDPYAYNSTDVSEYQRHSYSGMPPGMSFVCVPYYAIAKTWLWLVAAPARDRRIDNIYFGGPTSVWYNGKHSTVIFLNLFICVFGCSVLAGAMAALFYRALTVVHPDLAERSHFGLSIRPRSITGSFRRFFASAHSCLSCRAVRPLARVVWRLRTTSHEVQNIKGTEPARPFRVVCWLGSHWVLPSPPATKSLLWPPS